MSSKLPLVCWFSLDEPGWPPEQLEAWLSPDEVARFQRLRFPQHQRRQRAASAMLRRLLADVLNCRPDQLHFTRQEHGKPALPHREVEFNLSHSEGYAVLAIQPDHPVGVDIEDTRRGVNWASLAPRYFAPCEAERVIHAERPERLFFQTWTAKEAYIKAIGSGLFHALDRFITFQDQWGLWDISGAPLPWRLSHLQTPFPGAEAAWVGPLDSPVPNAYLYGPGGPWQGWPGMPAA